MEERTVDVVEEIAKAAEDAGLEVTRMEPVEESKVDSGYGAIMVGAALALGILGGGYAVCKGVKAGAGWISGKVKEGLEKKKAKNEDLDARIERAEIEYAEVKVAELNQVKGK